MNPESKFPASTNQLSSKQPGPLRWLLRFVFFLALFAVIVVLASYGIISLRGTDKPGATATQPPNQPTPAAQASEPPVLPSGSAGHAAATPAPRR